MELLQHVVPGYANGPNASLLHTGNFADHVMYYVEGFTRRGLRMDLIQIMMDQQRTRPVAVHVVFEAKIRCNEGWAMYSCVCVFMYAYV